ncbi:MAG: hypothetical protein K2J71_04675 [Oscillospiraceae bacterium]|nr:hypothetical protein [Oscillospiraceae bacterium]
MQIIQVNVCQLVLVKNISAVRIGFSQCDFCLNQSIECCLVCSIRIFDLGEVEQVIFIKFIENIFTYEEMADDIWKKFKLLLEEKRKLMKELEEMK